MHDRIKVEGKPGQLGDSVKIARNGKLSHLYGPPAVVWNSSLVQTTGDVSLTVSSNIPLSKRYLKYLTKKFLKKNTLRDWIRVVASSKDTYQLRFYNIQYVVTSVHSACLRLT